MVMAKKSKLEARSIRHSRLRKRIRGSEERPRLVVFRSARHIYAQVVDDLKRKTLVTASDLLAKAERSTEAAPRGKKTERAKQVGLMLARKCVEKGIKKVVFDRAGYQYHGRVSALAEGAREGGLEF
jgi:large subunit ribosomal protein L18